MMQRGRTECSAKRIVTSEAGLRTYRSMVNSIGVLHGPGHPERGDHAPASAGATSIG